MINKDTIEAFNTRQTINLNNTRTMTPGQQDQIKSWGSNAENLLKNKDLALFIHQYKFDLCDRLSELTGHTPDENNQRVALSNQIAGIDSFVAMLQRAVYYKNRVVTQQNSSEEPTEN